MSTETEDLDPLALYAIAQVAEGRTLQNIAEELGVTAATVFNRCTNTTELQRRYWLARETATDLLESELLDVARVASRQDAKAARVQASVLQWIIEKRDPHRYGNQLRLAHTSPDGSLNGGDTAKAVLAVLEAKHKAGVESKGG